MPKSTERWCARIINHAAGNIDKGLPDYPPVDIQTIPSNLSGEKAMEAAAIFYRILDEETNLGPKARILDFGCGWGRIARFLMRTASEKNICGVDVEPKTLSYAQQAMPQADFRTIDPNGPLPFEDASIDVAFSNSVFSHLSEKANRFYMAELNRCLKPGGVALISFLDHLHFERVMSGPPDAWLRKFIGDTSPAAEKAMSDVGFFYKYSGRIEDYGIAYASHDWMVEQVPAGLNVEKFRTDYVHTLMKVTRM